MAVPGRRSIVTQTDDGAYESELVCAFVEAELIDGRLNKVRLTSGHRDMLARWSAHETVSLTKVDTFLHRYGLMTWELEDWADREHGRTGYLVPVSA